MEFTPIKIAANEWTALASYSNLRSAAIYHEASQRVLVLISMSPDDRLGAFWVDGNTVSEVFSSDITSIWVTQPGVLYNSGTGSVIVRRTSTTGCVVKMVGDNIDFTPDFPASFTNMVDLGGGKFASIGTTVRLHQENPDGTITAGGDIVYDATNRDSGAAPVGAFTNGKLVVVYGTQTSFPTTYNLRAVVGTVDGLGVTFTAPQAIATTRQSNPFVHVSPSGKIALLCHGGSAEGWAEVIRTGVVEGNTVGFTSPSVLPVPGDGYMWHRSMASRSADESTIAYLDGAVSGYAVKVLNFLDETFSATFGPHTVISGTTGTRIITGGNSIVYDKKNKRHVIFFPYDEDTNTLPYIRLYMTDSPDPVTQFWTNFVGQSERVA